MRQKQNLLRAASLTVVSAMAALALLTGCGGDAGGGSPTPPPASSKPASSTPSGGDGGTEPDPDPDQTITQKEAKWNFTCQDGMVVLSSYTDANGNEAKLSGDVVLPATDGNGRPVTAIANGVFFQWAGLTSVTIPDTVTTIGDFAFRECVGLTRVKLPANLKTIGREVFAATNLTSIGIPNGVKEIAEGAFEYCDLLEQIYIPAGVTRLYKNTFDGCDKLQKIYYGGDKSQLEYLDLVGNKAEELPEWSNKIEHVDSSPLTTFSLFSLF